MKRMEKNVEYSGFRCNCLKIDVFVGVGASKFLEVQGILLKFSKTCPKSCRATFADRF